MGTSLYPKTGSVFIIMLLLSLANIYLKNKHIGQSTGKTVVIQSEI